MLARIYIGSNGVKKYAVLFLGMLALDAATLCGQTKSIVEYYPIADSICRFPPMDKQLAIICQKKVQGWYVNFVGVKGMAQVLLATVTKQQLQDVKDISLTVGFDGSKPTTGKIGTWGYVYDRNKDGNIDYLALVGGATPFKTKDFPADFPKRGKGLTRPELEYFIAHCQLLFNHWADDNFDDTLDAVVQTEIDSVRDWVERFIVARSTTFKYAFDDVWAFRDSIKSDRDQVNHNVSSVPFSSFDNARDEITWRTFGTRTGILQLLNSVAKACRLTEKNFIHPEEQ